MGAGSFAAKAGGPRRGPMRKNVRGVPGKHQQPQPQPQQQQQQQQQPQQQQQSPPPARPTAALAAAAATVDAPALASLSGGRASVGSPGRGPRPSRVMTLLTQADPVGENVRVVQYNVLADCYASTKMFPYARADVLSWGYRSFNILNELTSYDADIICLQEVDHFEDFFEPRLGALGYTGVFWQRPNRKADGCAIFYRADRFAVQREVALNFNDLAAAPADELLQQPHQLAKPRLLSERASSSGSGCASARESPALSPTETPDVTPPHSPLDALGTTDSDSDASSGSAVVAAPGSAASTPARASATPHAAAAPSWVRSTNNIASGLRLVTHEGAALWVFNTHLYWDPRFPNIKRAQAQALMRRLHALAREAADTASSVDVVLCGDLNSLPGSDVYALVTGDAQEHEKDKDVKGAAAAAAATSGNGSSTLRLRSIYQGTEGGEPRFTNFTQNFVGTLDYVFVSEGLAPLGALSFPAAHDLCGETALPNSMYSSDHLAVVTDLRWAPKIAPPAACALGVHCRDVHCRGAHPLLCARGPDCAQGDCALYHVFACKFGVTCQSKHCQYSHLPCHEGPFGQPCSNGAVCPYSHAVPCRFRDMCTRKECNFYHFRPNELLVGSSNHNNGGGGGAAAAAAALQLHQQQQHPQQQMLLHPGQHFSGPPFHRRQHMPRPMQLQQQPRQHQQVLYQPYVPQQQQQQQQQQPQQQRMHQVVHLRQQQPHASNSPVQRVLDSEKGGRHGQGRRRSGPQVMPRFAPPQV